MGKRYREYLDDDYNEEWEEKNRKEKLLEQRRSKRNLKQEWLQHADDEDYFDERYNR